MNEEKMSETKKDKQPDNMALWNSVCTTDPTTTKQVTQRGGFTAICAQSQRKRATEVWGMYGSTWGVKDLFWCTQGEAGVEIALEATFWYPGGKFPISVDTPFRAGNDTRKKLLTDLTTKALSMLGFNADVFEGKFDDNKYVSEMMEKFAKKPAPKKPAPKAQPVKPQPKSSFHEVMADMNKKLGDPTYFGVLKEQFNVDEAVEIKDKDKQGECYKQLLKLLKQKKDGSE